MSRRGGWPSIFQEVLSCVALPPFVPLLASQLRRPPRRGRLLRHPLAKPRHLPDLEREPEPKAMAMAVRLQNRQQAAPDLLRGDDRAANHAAATPLHLVKAARAILSHSPFEPDRRFRTLKADPGPRT